MQVSKKESMGENWKSACPVISDLESDLVRDALYALQGLPSAVKKLNRLSRAYNAASADKSSQNLTTLWTRSVTATALGKLLSVVARAGHLRCQLDAFVSFFLDGRPEDWDHSEDNQRRENKTKRKKKKKKKKDKNGLPPDPEKEIAGPQSVGPANSINYVSNPDLIYSRGLVNQAFAAAVRTVLRGHSAALNTLAASVAFRRLQDTAAHGFRAEYLRDQDPGPVIGYGCLDITLLEFYLHTRELRVQLQALAYICLRSNGRTFVGRGIGDDTAEEWTEGKLSERSQEVVSWNFYQSDHTRRGHRNTTSFEDFPRGADLLTYLYEQLMEVDPIHQELLRFLFERAYQPYSVFIRSWLYQAAVKDPYCEFVIEQHDFHRGSSSINARRKRDFDAQPTDLKLRKGVSVPRFLERVETQLIRAGQQLQVLMKLAETCDLAQQMGQNTSTSELFEGPEISSFTLSSDMKNSANLPGLIYSKRQLEDTVMRREKNRKVLYEQFDRLFFELAAVRQQKGDLTSPSTFENPPVNPVASDVDNEQLPTAISSELEQEAASPFPSNFPGNEEYTAVEMDGSYGLVKELTQMPVEVNEAGLTIENDPSAPAPDLRPTKNTEGPFPNLPQAAPPEESSLLHPTNGQHEVKSVSACKVGLDNHAPKDHERADGVGTYEPFQICTTQFRETAEDSNVVLSTTPPKVQSQSFIADHQRGASWPVWGLPTNPFLMPETIDDFTPHFYAYTSFAGTFHPWDVTTKLSKANLNSLQKSALEQSARKQAAISVEPVWFTSLASVFRDQLFEALNTHLEQLEWGIGYHGCELEFRTLDSSMLLDNRWKSQLLVELGDFPPTLHRGSDAAGVLPAPFGSLSLLEVGMSKEAEKETECAVVSESQVNSVLETDPSGKQPSKLQSSSESREESAYGELLDDADLAEPSRGESTALNEGGLSSETVSGLVALAGEISALRRSMEDRQVQELETEARKEANGNGAFKWEQHLWSVESPFENPVRGWSDGRVDEEDEETPLSVVVNKCIIQEVLCQYECVSTLTVRLFHEGLCLQDHYHALRRYFFMEQGDWADYFTAALCQNRWGPSGNQLRQMEVQGMLEAALQKSSCEGDEYAERLQVCFRSQDSASSSEASAHGSTKRSIAPFADCSRLDAFDFISLEYRVDWPLTLVLTSQSLQLYNVLFTFLMRIKLAVYALGDIWRRLQGLDKCLHKLSHSSHFQQQRNRFRTLQQLRQQTFHLVTTVQRYVESKLLFVVWSKFLQNIQLEVKDMQDLNTMHCAYLEGAVNECFLSLDTQGVKGCLDTIMQCVLDFLSHLKGAQESASNGELIDDHLFAQVCQVNKVFQSSLQLLNIYYLKQEPQYRTNLSDLWMILDFNGFVTSAMFSGQ